MNNTVRPAAGQNSKKISEGAIDHEIFDTKPLSCSSEAKMRIERGEDTELQAKLLKGEDRGEDTDLQLNRAKMLLKCHLSIKRHTQCNKISRILQYSPTQN